MIEAAPVFLLGVEVGVLLGMAAVIFVKWLKPKRF